MASIKFYKIPITERNISVEDKPLINILQEKFPTLYEREVTRIKLMYGEPSNPKNLENYSYTAQKLYKIASKEVKVDRHNRNTKVLYDLLGVPQYIIGIKQDEGPLMEYETSVVLSSEPANFLEVRRVSEEEAHNYMEKVTFFYGTRMRQLFCQKGKDKEKQKTLKSILSKKDN